MKVRRDCKECGGNSLTWDSIINTSSGVQEGRLRSVEMRCQFFLGCNDCSATVQVVSSDTILNHLNEEFEKEK